MTESFYRCRSGATRTRSRSGGIWKPIAWRKREAGREFCVTTGCASPAWSAITACRSAPKRPPTAGRPTDEPNSWFVALVVLSVLILPVLIGRFVLMRLDIDLRAPLLRPRLRERSVDPGLRFLQCLRDPLA